MKMPSMCRLSLALLCALATSLYGSAAVAADPSKRLTPRTSGARVPVAAAKNTAPANAGFPELEAFIEGLPDLKSAPANSLPPGLFETLSVKKGASVESVLQKYWRDLPFKSEHLRTAMFKLNPGLMKTATARTFSAAGTLLLPTAHSLRSALLPPAQPAPAAACTPPADTASGNPRGFNDERRSWVQFP